MNDEGPTPRLRVVVAEDNALLRDGLARLLAADADIEVAGVAADLDELLDLVADLGPDVVITDIRMPPTDTDEGIRAARALRERSPATGVVVLSQYASASYAIALLEGGAAGRAYLLKDRVSDAGELVRAVRSVADGGSVIDPRVVDHMMAARRPVDDPLSGLTPREGEVLELMARGASNAGIAATLGLSDRAVEKHISNLFVKLHLDDERDVNRRVRAVLDYLSPAF
jgi:DNA-binding NarL/FixJ family response regulator